MTRFFGLCLALTLGACAGGSNGNLGAEAVKPVQLDRQLCEVCGMTVDDQPSPRGQVVHRDGTHLHFCSLGDMRAYLETPSPRGKPVAHYVEALPESFEPAGRDQAVLPWVPASEAGYVVGFERKAIMGKPVASFATSQQATVAAARMGARTVSWGDLVSTPSTTLP